MSWATPYRRRPEILANKTTRSLQISACHLFLDSEISTLARLRLCDACERLSRRPFLWTVRFPPSRTRARARARAMRAIFPPSRAHARLHARLRTGAIFPPSHARMCAMSAMNRFTGATSGPALGSRHPSSHRGKRGASLLLPAAGAPWCGRRTPTKGARSPAAASARPTPIPTNGGSRPSSSAVCRGPGPRRFSSSSCSTVALLSCDMFTKRNEL